MALRPCQNASSRLTLVLCPAITIERLTTGDFINLLQFLICVGRAHGEISQRVSCAAHALLCVGRNSRLSFARFAASRRITRLRAVRRLTTSPMPELEPTRLH